MLLTLNAYDVIITVICNYDIVHEVIYNYDVIIHAGIGNYDVIVLTWQLLAPPCMKPEQSMLGVIRWG